MSGHFHSIFDRKKNIHYISNYSNCYLCFISNMLTFQPKNILCQLFIKNAKGVLTVATLLWVKWEDETPSPKVGDLESSGTPECLEFDSRGQNTLHWGVLCVIGKVLKCRCLKCPRIGHLDICSPSYGQKKGREY